VCVCLNRICSPWAIVDSGGEKEGGPQACPVTCEVWYLFFLSWPDSVSESLYLNEVLAHSVFLSSSIVKWLPLSLHAVTSMDKAVKHVMIARYFGLEPRPYQEVIY